MDSSEDAIDGSETTPAELSAASPSLREKLLNGEPVDFDREAAEESRTLDAKWLEDAARKGVRVVVRNAIIQNPLNLKYATLADEFSITGCQFKEPADFSYATFKHNVDLSRSTFTRGVDFSSAKADFDLTINRATFVSGAADFMFLHVGGVFSANYTHFNSDVYAEFSDAIFDRLAFFDGAVFEGQSNFVAVHAGKDVNFKGAEFKGKAVFSEAKIDGIAFFHAEPASKLRAAVFEDEAEFIAVQIGATAEFQGVKFLAEDKRIAFEQMRIGSAAHFALADFRGEADFTSVEIAGQAAFPGAIFAKAVMFNYAQIHQAYFAGHPESDGVPATFAAMVDFTAVHITSLAHFSGCEFNATEESVLFDNARFDGVTSFRGSIFEGPTSFRRMVASGEFTFSGAQFKRDAHFDGACFEDAVFGADYQTLTGAAVFESGAYFDGVRFNGNAGFGEVDFGYNASVNYSEVVGSPPVDDGDVVGSPPVDDGEVVGSPPVDDGEVSDGADSSFSELQNSAYASFVGVRFLKEATFDGSVFEGDADFRAAEFGAEARFDGATFRAKAIFDGSRFSGLAHFSAPEGQVEIEEQNLDSVRTSGDASANPNLDDQPIDAAKNLESKGADRDPNTTVFHNEASFKHARFEHDARFEGALFGARVSFRETSFRVLYFSEEGRINGQDQFQGNVDLRGCTYERIQIKWESMRSRLLPHSRQPFTHLEQVLRATGEDRKASEVYLDRRRVERKQKWQRRELLAWLTDALYATLANYGVRPYRLIVVPVVLVLLGTLVFSRPGAVRVKPTKDAAAPHSVDSAPPAESTTPAPTEDSTDFSLGDGFRMSVRIFLPTELPLVAKWEPSDRRFGPLSFSDYATLLKLAGWVLVPLGIGALTGLLRRVAP